MPAASIYRILMNKKALKADFKLQYTKNENYQVK